MHKPRQPHVSLFLRRVCVCVCVKALLEGCGGACAVSFLVLKFVFKHNCNKRNRAQLVEEGHCKQKPLFSDFTITYMHGSAPAPVPPCFCAFCACASFPGCIPTYAHLRCIDGQCLSILPLRPHHRCKRSRTAAKQSKVSCAEALL